MAIIIEENKKKLDLFVVSIVMFLIVSISSTAYYLFFVPAPLAEQSMTLELQSLQDISTMNFDFAGISENIVFKSLSREIPNKIFTGSIGRANPFLPISSIKPIQSTQTSTTSVESTTAPSTPGTVER